MKKIFRLTESELTSLIKNVIYEEESKKEKIKKIQKFLLKKGYDLGIYGDDKDGIDGIYGELTKKAVREFQKKHGNIKIDGKVGPETAKAMGNNIEQVYKGVESEDDKPKKEESKKSPEKPVSFNFIDITKKVINKLEGGYFNPEWHTSSGLGDSGETMFGMDRKHGTGYRDSPSGKIFWKLIDDNKSKKVWKHYYRGGQLESQLTELAAKQIESNYYSYKKKYLSVDANEIVDRTPKLIFHFAYACWNGPGFFQLFSEKINESVKKGITDQNELIEIALNSRKNFVSSKSGSQIVIRRGGDKMEKLFDQGLV